MTINSELISCLKMGENINLNAFEKKIKQQIHSESKKFSHNIQDMFLSNDEYLSLFEERDSSTPSCIKRIYRE